MRNQFSASVIYTRKLRQFEKTCLVCQHRLWGAKVRRYCSRVCQNKANYERHAETYRKACIESLPPAEGAGSPGVAHGGASRKIGADEV